MLLSLSLGLNLLSAQALSSDSASLYPTNLDQFLTKIDSLRAPKSEGLVFMRVWLDSNQVYVRAEVLANTNAELSSWVSQNISQIDWHSDTRVDAWYDLRFDFKPIDLAAPMALVDSLSTREFEAFKVDLPSYQATKVPYTPFHPPYIALELDDLKAVDLPLKASPLLAELIISDRPSPVSVPERLYHYIALETEALMPIANREIAPNLIGDPIEKPLIGPVEQVKFELAYIPLETDEISGFAYELSVAEAIKTELDIPTADLIEVEDFVLAYIPLETDEISGIAYELSVTEAIETELDIPTADLIEIEDFVLVYIPLETDEISGIAYGLSVREAIKTELDIPTADLIEIEDFVLVYIPLETDEINGIAYELSVAGAIETELDIPAADLMQIEAFIPAYISLETDALSFVETEAITPARISNRPSLPAPQWVKIVPYQPSYIALDCEALRFMDKDIQVEAISFGIIDLPQTSKTEVPILSLMYEPLDSEGLAAISMLWGEDVPLGGELAAKIPSWTAPVVSLKIFDPIDTRAIKPLIKGFSGLSAPSIHAPIITVDRPVFRFRSFLDTEELMAVQGPAIEEELIVSNLKVAYDWRPKVPVSRLNLFDLEREVTIPWMPEIAIYPQNMQDILDRIPYPESARKLELEGEVRFRIWLDDEGHYLRHEVMESLPYLTRLCEYLLPDVEYIPVLLHGNPIPFQTEISFHFDMNRGNPSECHYKDTRVTDNEFSY